MSRETHSVEELEIMAYLDGELSRGRAAGVAAHLEQCEQCQRVASELRGVSQELAAWQIESPELQITPRIAVALDDHERGQANASKRKRFEVRGFLHGRRLWAWGIASVAVILLVFAMSMPNLMRSRMSAELAQRKAMSRDNNPPAPSKDSNRNSAEYGRSSGAVEEREDAASRKTPGSPQLAGGGGGGRITELLIPTGPMVIRTANLGLSTTEFDRSRAKLEEILKRHNGYLGQLSVSGAADSGRTLEAVLRVPADQLDATLAELKGLGQVESESQKGDEVSQQYVDLQARLANARNTEQRLIEILRNRTGELSEVLAVEQEIASVRERIESMQAEKKSLEKQVDFSTLNLNMTEAYKPVHVVPDSTSTRIRNAAVAGYEMMVAGLINLTLFLFSWAPSLLLWGLVLFFPLRWLWRRRGTL